MESALVAADAEQQHAFAPARPLRTSSAPPRPSRTSSGVNGPRPSTYASPRALLAGGVALLTLTALCVMLTAHVSRFAAPGTACAGQQLATAPPASLAVVMPVVPCQQQRLAANLRTWQRHPPCSAMSSAALRRDATLSLVFYFNGDVDAMAGGSQSVRSTLRGLWASLGGVQRCFAGGMHILSANLTAQEDKYPVGTCLQYHRALPLLRRLGFDHWLLMEPDVLPLRANWGASVAELAAGNAGCRRFWQAGSIPVFKNERYDVLHLKDKSQYVPDTHLNGNSLYCLADPAFDDFFTRVQAAQRHGFCGEMQFGYDFAMWRFRNHHANRRYMNFRFSKFLVSDFIVNFGERPYDADAVRREQPGIMLVHGKTAFDDQAAVSECAQRERVRGLQQLRPPPASSLALPAACSARVLSLDFRRFDFSYMLVGAAQQLDGPDGGVQLTSDAPSQIGRVEVDSLHSLSGLCAATPGDCSLFAHFEFRIGRNESTKLTKVADGMAIAFVDGGAQLPGRTLVTTVLGVVVPTEALVVILDEHDNGGADSIGYVLVDTRGNATRVLARRRGLHARYLRGDNVALRAEVRADGTRLAFVMDGDRLFEPVTLEPAFPDAFYISVLANTGDLAVAHHLLSLQLCSVED
jgi:hypothetical protein